MAVSTFTSATELLDTLGVHKLLNASQLKRCSNFVRESPGISAQHLIQFALEQNILTPFQAEHVSAGNAHTLLLSPYVLLDNAGSGHAGQVYQARHQENDQRHTIKILARGTRAGTQRVTQTLRKFATFRASGVVPITHIGTVSERTYMVWPDATDGQSLEQRVQERGKMSAKEVVFYGAQAAHALHACHQAGLFHGLFKAADLQIDEANKVAIKDFGMGFLLTLDREESTLDTMTSLGQLANGLDWASPESLADQRDRTALSDQYSLGCVLYYGLTGEVPFPVVSKVRKMMAHQTDEPTSIRELVPDAPGRLVAIIERLMQKVPAERYADMAEVETALRGLLVKAVASPTTPSAKPTKLVTKTSSPTAPAQTGSKRPAKSESPQVAPGERPAGGEDTSLQWVAWTVPIIAGVAACILGWLLLG